MRRGAHLALRLALTAVVAVFVGRSLARNWGALRGLELSLAVEPLWIVTSLLLTWVTYLLQVASWRAVLRGWRQSISYGAAVRAWCLANMGRYVPGKVWSIAGLVILAQRAGAAAGPAAASAFAVQALGLSTCVLVVAATLPAVPVPLLAATAVGGIAVLATMAWDGALRWVNRISGNRLQLEPLPLRTVLTAALLTGTAWITYGLAFWALARGVGQELTWHVAVGVFAIAYLVGLLAIVVPGGVGVREAAMVGQLASLLGGGGALALSVASRLVLTLAEISSALAALVVIRDGSKEKPGDREP